jgi:predicted DNA-binding transcriptional regulator AlpA
MLKTRAGEIIGDRLNVRQCARYVGISESFLNKARLAGDGPVFMKIGKLVMYDRADVDSWLRSCRRASTSAQSTPEAA